jgi:hypothetical protein
VYDYWLGGKDNLAADREAGDQAIKIFPNIVLSARANRAFLARAVRFQAGIRQFLDIGTGMPAGNNTHEITARSIAASSVTKPMAPPLASAGLMAATRPFPADRRRSGQ